jgi:hypothetical protein
MVAVTDDETLRHAGSAPRAILMLHAEWSMPSVLVLRTVRQWEENWLRRSTLSDLPLFIAIKSDWYPPSVLAWMGSAGVERFRDTGNGEMLWLENGRVVEYAFGSRLVTDPELTRRTRERWGSGRTQA